MATRPQVPTLAGVYHLKLPVRDLARSRDWYSTRLGYEVAVEFIEEGRLMGYPMRAEASAGFDYFSIGVPDKPAIDKLAGQLTALGEEHAGVQTATFGWILPMLHDPDGHEIRFYTISSHTSSATPQSSPSTPGKPRSAAGTRTTAQPRPDTRPGFGAVLLRHTSRPWDSAQVAGNGTTYDG
jgi:catechol 2,3-dioxygenase-like lactoylglutathione lyase family enzyme